jgi:RTX calcium-binding nonapeptide repeat (4 copies)
MQSAQLKGYPMPEGVTKQTANIFVMQMPDGTGTFRQVTVHGHKLSYDPATGMITGGLVSSLRYDIILDDGKTRYVSDSHTWGGLNTDARLMAEAFGSTYWNHVKVVTERFATLDSFTNVVRSFFTPDKAAIDGTDLAERLQGSFRAEAIDGRAGDDLLMGLGGNDSLNGGDGDDRLRGGAGDDTLTDTAGKRNIFSGGAGDDRMVGGAGNDQMSGDAGNDMFTGNGGFDAASGGRGVDTFVFDSKADGTLRIYDFSVTDDLLAHAQIADAKEAYVNFISNAVQVGRNVEYHDGNQTVVLMRLQLDKLVVENFVGTTVAPDILI